MEHTRFLKAASGAALIVLMSTAALAATDKNMTYNKNNNAANAAAASSQPASVSHATKKFIKDAWQGNQLEIQTSQRALDKSRNADVRKFAEQMIKDHKDAEAKLEDCISPIMLRFT